MDEVTLLREFFQAWSELQAMPVKKGRPDAERQAAMELVKMRADAVRRFVPGSGTVAITQIDPALAEYRTTQAQVAAIPPKDTRKGAQGPKGTIANG